MWSSKFLYFSDNRYTARIFQVQLLGNFVSNVSMILPEKKLQELNHGYSGPDKSVSLVRNIHVNHFHHYYKMPSNKENRSMVTRVWKRHQGAQLSNLLAASKHQHRKRPKTINTFQDMFPISKFLYKFLTPSMHTHQSINSLIKALRVQSLFRLCILFYLWALYFRPKPSSKTHDWHCKPISPHNSLCYKKW